MNPQAMKVKEKPSGGKDEVRAPRESKSHMAQPMKDAIYDAPPSPPPPPPAVEPIEASDDRRERDRYIFF